MIEVLVLVQSFGFLRVKLLHRGNADDVTTAFPLYFLHRDWRERTRLRLLTRDNQLSIMMGFIGMVPDLAFWTGGIEMNMATKQRWGEEKVLELNVMLQGRWHIEEHGTSNLLVLNVLYFVSGSQVTRLCSHDHNRTCAYGIADAHALLVPPLQITSNDFGKFVRSPTRINCVYRNHIIVSFTPSGYSNPCQQT